MLGATTLLPRVLIFDAATCIVMGLALSLGAGPLGEILSIPAAILRGAGLVLLPFAALLIWAARRPHDRRPVVGAIIAANVAWVLASGAILLTGLVTPNGLGYAFVIGQALVVAAIAEVEAVALRRATMATA